MRRAPASARYCTVELTDRDAALFGRPRVALIGTYRNALGQSDDGGFAGALAGVVAARRVMSATTPGAVRALSALLHARECEAVHLLDPRFAAAGRIVRRLHGVPVSVTLSAADAAGAGIAGRLRRMFAAGLDQAFVTDASSPDRRRKGRLAIAEVAPFAVATAEPPQRLLDRAASLLDGIAPGRLVIGMPWPRDDEHVRWYRDAVAPLLHGNPVCLLLGAPGRREVRLLVGAVGMRATFRAWTGALDAGMVSAAARCVDAFVVTGEAKRGAGTSDLLLALTASGAPVVAGGGVRSPALAHERNALVVAPADAFGLVSSLNQLLALPAVQRHYLGQGFASWTLSRFTPAEAAAAHAERIAALVGRPPIPAQWRAA